MKPIFKNKYILFPLTENFFIIHYLLNCDSHIIFFATLLKHQEIYVISFINFFMSPNIENYMYQLMRNRF